ncbi:hypothetical protein Poli38472_001731 [Pythium oligandrum]|uniref:Uncharacterized protein n=1 Tax=Pythium oligandrum TaxID=41045 RepID=A0A8K1CVR6_PYTOL|nr:hypothetical protein Poli38472_001731 [Pythium oligandrum]|eukprot:TMW69575.1 hypothetical protein Poli38472_001731 [Pythium oligandrum]
MSIQRKTREALVMESVGKGDGEELLTEEEYRKKFEPVAPWNREGIPDYGPLRDRSYLVVFFVIGVLATLGYEYTDYFDQIDRWIAYLAIWFPLWFRLLGRVSPQLTEEDLDRQEQEDFRKELARIQKEAEELDEDVDE